jgi:hypothetical protein
MSAQKRKRAARKKPKHILVLKKGDANLSADDIIKKARKCRAITVDNDGATIYWIKWPEHNVYDMTEQAIRNSIATA